MSLLFLSLCVSYSNRDSSDNQTLNMNFFPRNLFALSFLFCKFSYISCLHTGPNFITVNFTDPDHGPVERSYILYIPKSYSDQFPVPLVFEFHGWTSSAQNQMESESQMHVLAEEFGFIVVFVDGVPDSPSGWRSWNINDETGPYGDVCDRDRETWGVYECHYSCEDCDEMTTCKAGMTCYNDLAFVEWLLEDIKKQINIDTYRIHATGFSNGGQFTYYLASYSSIQFASVAVVSGSPLLGFGPLPKSQVPIIDFHGLQDDVIPHSIEFFSGQSIILLSLEYPLYFSFLRAGVLKN